MTAAGDLPAAVPPAAPTGRLAGKVAIVTGAAQGAGRGIAEAFVAAGARVALVGRTLSTLQDVAAALPAGSAHPIVCDVGDPSAIEGMVADVVGRWGGVQVLVHAAHHAVRGGALLELADSDAEALWTTGPLATWRLMRACHPHLRGDGTVITFGSGAQFGPEGYGMYAATKDAVRTLTRAAAVEWGRDGIRVHMIVPHVVSPAFEADLARRGAAAPIERIPVGRLGRIEDVGRVAVFLATPDSGFLTGQVFMVDGGMMYHR